MHMVENGDHGGDYFPDELAGSAKSSLHVATTYRQLFLGQNHAVGRYALGARVT